MPRRGRQEWIALAALSLLSPYSVALSQPCHQGPELILRDSIGPDNTMTNGNLPIPNWRVGSPPPYYVVLVSVTAPQEIVLSEWRAILAPYSPIGPTFSEWDYALRVWSSMPAYLASPFSGDVTNIAFDTPTVGPTLFGTSGPIPNSDWGSMTTWDFRFDLTSAQIQIPAGATRIVALEVSILSSQTSAALGCVESSEPGPSDGFCSGGLPDCPIPVADHPWSINSGRIGVAILGHTVITAGDMNNDGALDVSDAEHFAAALADPDAFQSAFPNVPIQRGDMNCDGILNGNDIRGFVNALLVP